MRFIGVIIALALALVAGLAILHFFGNSDKKEVSVMVDPKAPQTTVQTVDILVAAKDIPVGTQITDSSFFDRQPWPKHLVLEQFIPAEQAPSVINTVTRGQFFARDPLTRSRLANPNDPSFLAASIPEGMRVVTLPVDKVSGLAGFIFPGDRVDILYTHDAPPADDSANPTNSPVAPRMGENGRQTVPSITEILTTDIRVLAVDQKSSAGGTDQLKAPETVSVEVTPNDAQRIRLAQTSGKVSLALRSLKDKDTKTTVPPTQESDLTNAGPKVSNTITIVRGVKSEIINSDLPVSKGLNDSMPTPMAPTEPTAEGIR